MTEILTQEAVAKPVGSSLTDERARWSDYLPIALLCAGAALMLFWRLGLRSLEDWDEALYMQMCKEMVQTGNWLTLHLDGKPWYDKPPLFFWATSLLYKLFGITEFTSRAVSAASGVGVLAVTWLIGRRAYDAATGMVAGVILLSSYQFVWSSRFATTDIMLTFFLLLAVYGYLRLQTDGPRMWYAICLAITAAFMIKSAAAVVAPAAIALCAVLDRQALRWLRTRQFWLAVLLSLAVMLPWHAYMLALHGEAFWRVYFGWNLVERATSTFDQHVGGPEYYFHRLYRYFFPWVLLAVFAVAAEIEQFVRGRTRGRIVLVFTLVVLLLYTVVKTKLRWYIVPLYPTLALSCAALVVRAVRQRDPAAMAGLVVAAVIAACTSAEAMPPVFALIAGGVTIGVWVWWSRAAIAFTAVAACALLLAIAMPSLVPLYTEGESQVESIGRVVRRHPSTLPLIAADGFERPAARFYCDRSVVWAYNRAQLHRYMADGQPREVIIQDGKSRDLKERYEVKVIGRAMGANYVRLTPRRDLPPAPTSQPMPPTRP
jgi:4-amino-4-deoxy-L-arabinose transferase-like glycosyltransferase